LPRTLILLCFPTSQISAIRWPPLGIAWMIVLLARVLMLV